MIANYISRHIFAAIALSAFTAVSADPIPISAFARLPAISSVSISPDGRYLAWIRAVSGTRVAVVLDRHTKSDLRVVLAADKDSRFQLSWCNWANATRLICSYRAMHREVGFVYPISRLVAVNADGSKMKVLIQNGRAGASQFQDQVIDWTPDEPDTVLIEADDDRNTFPSVFRLNVYTGGLSLAVREREPIRSFRTDGRGNVRLGWGFLKKKYYYFAKIDGEKGWQQLAKTDAFSDDNVMRPIAIGTDANKVYAMALHEGRDALWEMDLMDRNNPTLLVHHPRVDVDGPILAPDGRLIGVRFQTEKPFAHYIDNRSKSVIEAVKPLLTDGAFHSIHDYSLDQTQYVIRTNGDIDSDSYAVLDTKTGKLEKLGHAYPELATRRGDLSPVKSIRYSATDGTEIPGYLTVPAGQPEKNLPLVVLPHGGPVARDEWRFDWLVQFLASRGYAVLQMNFRGSSGYGHAWQFAAHQDWGGLTYSDIVDGTHWAIKEGIADPQRICIVGWSFGGYAALLGAVRNSDLFKCSASIAGVSDLIDLQDDTRGFIGSAISREQIGVDRDKLKADSPRRHAESVNIPVLMVHGDLDFQVNVQHSQDMTRALKRAKKDYKYVEIKEADHGLTRESERTTMLTELEAFLAMHLATR